MRHGMGTGQIKMRKLREKYTFLKEATMKFVSCIFLAATPSSSPLRHMLLGLQKNLGAVAEPENQEQNRSVPGGKKDFRTRDLQRP